MTGSRTQASPDDGSPVQDVPIEAWWSAAEHVQVSLGGGRYEIFVRRLGTGPDMTLLHGFPSSSYDWAKVAPALAGRYSLLMFDFLGFGASGKPADHRYSIHEQADAVEQIWSQLGITGCRLVAHDYGATVEAQRRIGDAGYELSRRSDVAPGTPDVLVLDEPGTGIPLHLYRSQSRSGAGPGPAHRPTKLGHVASFTPSLKEVQGFYQDLLGFRWSDTIGDFFVFLRCNADHHAANFLESTKLSGMHHVAYEMRDLYHLQTTLDHLARNGYRLIWGPGRHGPGHNIFTYHRDPHGSIIELFTELDTMIDEANGFFEPRPWHEDSPQVPKTWQVDVATANAWGPILPEILHH